MDRLTRYIGLDVHKQYVIVDQQQTLVLKAQKVAIGHFSRWAETQLQPTDKVALEATSNAWAFYDQLQGRVEEVVVANAYKIKLISSSRVKTDRQDAVVLAKLLAANLVPGVWVPPPAVRELRGLVAHRQQLVKARSASKNRLQSLLQRHNIALPGGSAFSKANQTWWDNLTLPPGERLQLQHERLQLAHQTTLIEEVERAIGRLSVSEAWREQATLLIHQPGIGMLGAMTILSAIGDISRFPTAKQLVGYAGLGASVHASGQTYQTGGITKQGRRELRTALVECAWIAVQRSDHWRTQFTTLARRMNRKQVITVIARKMLVAIWHLLTKHQADKHVSPQRAARGLMLWVTCFRLAAFLGMTRADFVRQQLIRLGLAEPLDPVSAETPSAPMHFAIPQTAQAP